MLHIQKLKVLILVFSFSMIGFSLNANAAHYHLGGISGDNDYISNLAGAGSVIDDVWSFTITDTSDVSIAIAATELIVGSKTFLDADLVAKFSGSFLPVDGSFTTFSDLAAGTYAIFVKGFTTGKFGGSYGLSVDVAPVPLPAAFFLFMSGLGGLFAARKLKTVKTSALAC